MTVWEPAVGDDVLIRTNRAGVPHPVFRKAKVARITNTQIILDNERRFRRLGRQAGLHEVAEPEHSSSVLLDPGDHAAQIEYMQSKQLVLINNLKHQMDAMLSRGDIAAAHEEMDKAYGRYVERQLRVELLRMRRARA